MNKGDSGPAKRSMLVRRALVIALCAVWTEPPYAAHPFITDDTGTQGAGNWQLELMVERDRNARTADPGGGAVHQVRKLTLFNPVLTYGILDTLDVALGLNRLRQRTTEDGAVTQSATGTGDSTLELKWRFYEANGMSLALKPGVVLPTGDENRGLGSGKPSWGVNFIFTQEVKPWAFLANVAYTRARYKLPADADANRAHLWRASAGLAYSVRDDVRLVGEVGARTNPARDDPFLPGRNGHFAMLGLIYSPSDKIDLDVGVRKRLNHAEFDTAILVGATFRW
ncbi:MAG: transporter [Betaproteobacteria bacterium]|nr:transporter [Betaproteobacteria bacterium]